MTERSCDRYQAPPCEGMKVREAVLDEDDDLWLEFRHQHIAVVSQ